MEYYIKLCRHLSQRYHTPVEIRQCPTGNDLLFDLDNSVFKKKLDVVLYSLCHTNTLKLASAIRDSGYMGLIIFLGSEETEMSPETLFDIEIFNFIRKGHKQKNVERFADVFRKVIETIAKLYQEKLVFAYAGEIYHIAISDILYFEKQDRGLNVYHGNDEKHYFISSIANLENQLKGKGFYRSSLSYLVSIDAIRALNSDRAVMLNGKEVPVGRQYYAELKEAIKKKAVAL